ncbi:MAG TPA: hypothetical protein VN901_12165 [Candidatus Acidoferrales bacterium]|nr:hypothetical protein [Candidatus Acidoferrales bacterium]
MSGIPIMQVRDFFRRIVAWHGDSFDVPCLRDQLSLDENPAMALASELVAQGYLVSPLYAKTPQDGDSCDLCNTSPAFKG